MCNLSRHYNISVLDKASFHKNCPWEHLHLHAGKKARGIRFQHYDLQEKNVICRHEMQSIVDLIIIVDVATVQTTSEIEDRKRDFYLTFFLCACLSFVCVSFAVSSRHRL